MQQISQPPRGQLLNIQALRGLAAAMVVFHHLVDSFNNYIGTPFSRLDVEVGAAGVDIFFVISGYIMMEVSARRPVSAMRFMADRLLRVAPIYWTLTLLAAVPIALGLRLFGHDGLSLSYLASSLLFIQPYVDGSSRVFPLLFVGWTLNYEILFYSLFALCLATVGRKHAALGVTILLATLFTLAHTSRAPNFAFWGNPIIFEFAAGALAWHLLQAWKPSVREAFTGLGLGVGGLLAGQLAGLSISDPWQRVLWMGLPAILIVISAIALERLGQRVRSRALVAIGDSSYSLYLTHVFVIQMAGKVALAAGFITNREMAMIWLFITGALALVVGWITYRWIEVPQYKALTRRHRNALS